MSIYKLENVVQNYAWGSTTAMHDMFGVDNPNNEPQAELWMGAHQNGCSKIADTGEKLSAHIAHDKKEVLGSYTENRFGDLPFLFKVLAAADPLSIQVHPNKVSAEKGFAKENEQGIPLDATTRNYKDPNHKPELVYALSFYKAMNGFRPIEEIVSIFKTVSIPTLSHAVANLEAEKNENGLRSFFVELMSLTEEKKQSAVQELCLALSQPTNSRLMREIFEYVSLFQTKYQDDIGLFSPLILNTVELEPGEAMFLNAETPHAYVSGTALEIMANSDNVLRAGLTPKHIDIDELVANTRFVSTSVEHIKLNPIQKDGKLSYPLSVDDFSFEILEVAENSVRQYVRSAEILFCIDGEIELIVPEGRLNLKPGESAFVECGTAFYEYLGDGRLARAFN